MNDDTNLEPGEGIRVECFMLCDYASVENGKLNILGGGWEELTPPRFPYEQRIGLAVRIVLPGKQILHELPIRIEAVDGSGRVADPPLMDGRLHADDSEHGGAEAGEPPDCTFRHVSETVMGFTGPERIAIRLVVGDDIVATTRRLVSALPLAEMRSAS